VLALLSEPELSQMVRNASRELNLINSETLATRLLELTADSVEARQTSTPKAVTGPDDAVRGGKTPFLDQYTTHLTEHARHGKIDPVLAREGEIRKVIDILTRRRQNNPILVGEAGVGKTAVGEEVGLRVG